MSTTLLSQTACLLFALAGVLRLRHCFIDDASALGLWLGLYYGMGNTGGISRLKDIAKWLCNGWSNLFDRAYCCSADLGVRDYMAEISTLTRMEFSLNQTEFHAGNECL
jgi:hypothetical protein